MSRHVAAVAIALCLSPAWVQAQTTRFTVSTDSADVHKFPSIGSPVIAQAPRGRVLEVRRELGSWVAVSWPGGDNDLGYLHITSGSIARGIPPTAARVSGSAQPASQRAQVPPRAEQVAPPRTATPMPSTQVFVTPPPHYIGIGGRVGAAGMGAGLSARGWRHQDHLGFQLTFSHTDHLSAFGTGELSSTSIEPSVLYAFKDRVGDYIWVRPFVGSGLSVRRQSVNIGGLVSATDTAFGVHSFAGTEFAVSAWPKFAVSTDLNYRWSDDEIPGFDLGGVGLSIAAHWYIK